MAIEASKKVYFAAATALMGAMCVGVAIGYTSPALETMLEKNNVTSEDRIAKNGNESIVGASIAIGALIGSLIAAPLSQFAGRKKSLIIIGFPYAIGCGVIFIAKSLISIIIGRIIIGFNVGMICVVAPSYVVEISTPSTRGLLGAGFQIFVTIGIFIMALFGIFATVTYNYFFNWRYLALFGVLPSAVMSLAMLGMPESPTWLLSKYGRSNDKAEKALSELRTTNSDVQAELNELQEQANQSKSLTLSTKELKKPDYWKPAVLGIFLMIFQQFSGINVVLFFQTKILKDARGNDKDSEESSANFAAIGAAITTLAQVLASIVGGFLLDRMGRRRLLLLSGGGHAVSLFVLGFYFYSKNPARVIINNTTNLLNKGNEVSSLPSWLPVACLVVYIIAYSIGYGPIPWLMIPEMTPAAVRSVVVAVATAVNWSCAFFTAFTFSSIVSAIGVSTTYWIYSVLCATSCVFVMLFVPETKGKSFDEIQREFQGKASPPIETKQSPVQVQMQLTSSKDAQQKHPTLKSPSSKSATVAIKSKNT